MAQTFANDSTVTWGNLNKKKVKIDKITASVAMDATLAPGVPF
jgi:hypothetical protein